MSHNGYISLEAAAKLMAIDGEPPCMKAVLNWVVKGTSGLRGFGPAAIERAGLRGVPPVKLQATFVVHRWATRAEWVEQFLREIAQRKAAVQMVKWSNGQMVKSDTEFGGIEFVADPGSQRDARTGLMTVPRPDKVGAYPPSRRKRTQPVGSSQ